VKFDLLDNYLFFEAVIMSIDLRNLVNPMDD